MFIAVLFSISCSAGTSVFITHVIDIPALLFCSPVQPQAARSKPSLLRAPCCWGPCSAATLLLSDEHKEAGSRGAKRNTLPLYSSGTRWGTVPEADICSYSSQWIFWWTHKHPQLPLGQHCSFELTDVFQPVWLKITIFKRHSPAGRWQTHDWDHGPAEPGCNGQHRSRGRLWLSKDWLHRMRIDICGRLTGCCYMFYLPSPPCPSATTWTSSGWWSGRLAWSAARMTWRAPATCGSLPSAWRTHGCSASTSSCGRRTCPSTVPSPWATPGPTPSRGSSCCSHWSTPSTATHIVHILSLFIIIKLSSNPLSCPSAAVRSTQRRPARRAPATTTSLCGATTWSFASAWLNPASCRLVTSELPPRRLQPPRQTAVSPMTTR